MRKICQEEFIVMRTGRYTLFMKVKGSEPHFFRESPDTDCILRAPFIVTDKENPDETIFVDGDIIKITIEFIGKEKYERKR